MSESIEEMNRFNQHINTEVKGENIKSQTSWERNRNENVDDDAAAGIASP